MHMMLDDGYVDADLAQALRKAWCKETAYPPCQKDYESKHPSWGNCFVSTLVIWAVQGGDVWAGKVDMPSQKSLWHFRNYFPTVESWVQLDATWEQFEPGSTFRRVSPLERAEFKEMIKASIWDDETLLPRLELLIERLETVGGYKVDKSALDIIDNLQHKFRFVLQPEFLTGPAQPFPGPRF